MSANCLVAWRRCATSLPVARHRDGLRQWREREWTVEVWERSWAAAVLERTRAVMVRTDAPAVQLSALSKTRLMRRATVHIDAICGDYDDATMACMSTRRRISTARELRQCPHQTP